MKHTPVKEAIVKVHGESANKIMVAYVVPEHSREGESGNLRDLLLDYLPSYMIPSIFISLEKFPVLPSGKVDYRALPAPNQTSLRTSARSAPQSALEQQIATIVQELLPVNDIDVHANLFQMGAHSLLMVQLKS